jgi:trehalose 6-phosphate synthase/phosphatase
MAPSLLALKRSEEGAASTSLVAMPHHGELSMSRLIIVSNRLPYTLRQNGTNLESSASTGGLVTALAAYVERERREQKGFESIWVGWPGGVIPNELVPRATDILADQQAVPVFLTQEDGDEFYYGFCNRTLWPLFHYFTSYVDYSSQNWETYVRVNRAFCDVVANIARPEDTVWIHDYHLLLLPEMLRAAQPALNIGFFLHTPFPSFEIFRLLPSAWKQQISRGMLGADLIGFHVHEYTQHFLQCMQRILGYEHRLGKLVTGDRVLRADTFPLGVDFPKFAQTAESDAVAMRTRQIRSELGQIKIIISVDRLDYTKGISDRLQAYELFLERHPEWQRKVTFVLLVVPSRVEVPQYRQMKEDLDERVGKLNGRFATLGWAPLVYQYHQVDFEELVALYQVADVALITPLRDGMNLVAKEYLASKPDASGVLILSELAGAAREMNEAVLINPHDQEEMANALALALGAPRQEQVRRNRIIRERLKKFDASGWAKQFLSTLAAVKAQQGRLATKRLAPPLQAQVVNDFRAAQHSLLLLDYDGTLVPIAQRPEQAVPSHEVLALLTRLARDPKNAVYVISGRDRMTLERWLGETGIGFVAEHGAWLKDPGGQFKLSKPLSADWKGPIGSILRLFVSQVDGSLLEEKDYAMAWHYRGADPELGAQRAKELVDELTQYTANLDIHVLEGKKVVEVRSAGADKGSAAADLILRLQPGFILAVGDDHTDEDVFRVLPPSATSIHVGSPFSNARFCLGAHDEVLGLLKQLAQASGGPKHPWAQQQ